METRFYGSLRKLHLPNSNEWFVNDHLKIHFNYSNIRNLAKLKQTQSNDNYSNQNQFIYPRSYVSKLFNPNDRINIDNIISVKFPNLIGKTHQTNLYNLRRMSSQIMENAPKNLASKKDKTQNDEENLIYPPKNENNSSKNNKIKKGLCLNIYKKKNCSLNPKINYQHELIS